MFNCDDILKRAWDSYEEENYVDAFDNFNSISGRKPIVLHHIGLMYYKGLGTKINHKKAKEFFIKSTELGIKEGFFYLGRYEILHGNKTKGFNDLVKAAKLESLPAYQFLGAYYDGGHIKEKNVKKSLYYLNLGMKLEHAYCTKFLGQKFINNSNGFFSKICGYYLLLRSAWIIIRYGTRTPMDPRVDIGALTREEDKLIN